MCLEPLLIHTDCFPTAVPYVIIGWFFCYSLSSAIVLTPVPVDGSFPNPLAYHHEDRNVPSSAPLPPLRSLPTSIPLWRLCYLFSARYSRPWPFGYLYCTCSPSPVRHVHWSLLHPCFTLPQMSLCNYVVQMYTWTLSPYVARA